MFKYFYIYWYGCYLKLKILLILFLSSSEKILFKNIQDGNADTFYIISRHINRFYSRAGIRKLSTN